MPTEILRVATLNLWGESGPWNQRRQVLMDGLRELQPDLIAFQESIKTDEYDQIADLLASDFHIIHQTNRQANGSGVSIASRWPANEVHEGHTFTPRNALMTDWDWPFRRIDYIFVRCGKHGGPTLAIASCERIFDEPVNGVWASDHFGLVADLTLPPKREAP